MRPTLGTQASRRQWPGTGYSVKLPSSSARTACLAEAVRGLVAVFADTAGVVASRSVAFMLGPAGDEEQLVRLLEEVIYLVEVDGVVPVDVRVQLRPDGGLRGRLGVAPLQAAIVIGPAPKAIAWHELSLVPERTGWRCRVTLDV